MYDQQLRENHGLYPGDIITVEQMHTLTRHYKTTLSATNDNFERVISKNFNPDERKLTAGLYQKLRESGFYPDGLNDNGGIRWKVATKSAVHAEMEKGLDKYCSLSVQENKDRARSHFKGFMYGNGHV